MNSMDLSREEMEESGKCHLNKSSYLDKDSFFFLGGVKDQQIGTLTFISSDPKALRRVPQPKRSEQVEIG